MLLDKHYDMIAALIVHVALCWCLNTKEMQNTKKLLVSN